ncbi:MAG: SLC13 family permease [Hyphomicrobiaceae bacterium]
MTNDQYILFGILFCLFALLLWGRIRYDIVALGALVVAVVVGIIPGKTAFEGFGHPATIIIALVLVVSKGLANSGAVDLIARWLVPAGRSLLAHIGVMAGLGAAMSALMNNVGALALLMPVDIQAAEREKRSPAITLMPLSFATILGGLITLIGTPPNIIISSIREERLGEPFKMFDFAPVGIACAVAGVAFVALIGWRLLPKATREREAGKELFDLGSYLVELRFGPESKSIGKTIGELEDLLDGHDTILVELIRDGMQVPGYARWMKARDGDVLLVETVAENLDKVASELDLSFGAEDITDQAQTEKAQALAAAVTPGDVDKDAEVKEKKLKRPDNLSLIEVVVRPGAAVEGRTAMAMRLYETYGVWLIGISREGRKVTRRVRSMTLRAGDVLLLLGTEDMLQAASEHLGTLPLAERGLQVRDGQQAAIAAAIFAVAIGLASVGMMYLPVALAAVTILYVLLKIVPLRQLYDAIEWPVVVLIGSLIPIGAALEKSGGTELLANWIVSVSQGAPAWMVLTLLMIVTMTLSDVLNNTATALIAAPVGIGVANSLGVSPDPFLMAVAIAASCAFLTPIGHKNNTLIMGPGGYSFGDYWRMGLPLEILIVAVAVPMILIVWPL